MTAGKGKGVLSHTPISKPDLPETTAARAPLQACDRIALLSRSGRLTPIGIMRG